METTNAEKRLEAQIESDREVFDLKVDLLQYMTQNSFAKNNTVKIEHQFQFETIEEKDLLLIHLTYHKDPFLHSSFCSKQ